MQTTWVTKVEARRYHPRDWDLIKSWGAEWGAEYEEALFPTVGFLVENIAAYFLYQTDSNVCYLENLISKKSASAEEKSQAFKLLIDAILKEAADLGFTVAYATTNIIPVMLLAKEHGAEIRPGQCLLIKDLTTHQQLNRSLNYVGNK